MAVVGGQAAHDRPQQAALVLAHLVEQALGWIDGDVQQSRFQFLQRVGTREHLDDEPAPRAGQGAPAQGREESGPDHARLAAPAGSHHGQKATPSLAPSPWQREGRGGGRSQPCHQLLGQRLAAEEVGGICFQEGS